MSNGPVILWQLTIYWTFRLSWLEDLLALRLAGGLLRLLPLVACTTVLRLLRAVDHVHGGCLLRAALASALWRFSVAALATSVAGASSSHIAAVLGSRG